MDLHAKCARLQALVGDSPVIEVGKFENWGQTQSRSEILSVRPQTLSDIQAVVRACRETGTRIRAAGATHSWSPLYSDEGHLVMYTKDLRRHDGPQIQLLQSDSTACDKLVRVMSNVTVGELLEFEVTYGVCLPANVVLRVVTCAGVVIPGCHGVGRDCSSVSDYVAEMTIVNSDGDLQTYSVEKDGEDMMRAVQVNMGLFGIIYDITFKMEHLKIVKTKNIFPTVEETFYNKNFISHLFKNNWSVEIFWFPFNSMEFGELTKAIFDNKIDWSEWQPKKDRVWIRLVNPLEIADEVEPPEVYILDGIRANIEQTLGQAFEKLITNFPSLTPHFTNAVENSLVKQFRDHSPTQQLPHAIHYRDYVEKFPVWDMEWALDWDDELETFSKSTQYVIEKVASEASAGRFPLTLVLELRLMGHSEAYLCPSTAGSPGRGGSGQTMHVEVLSLQGTHGWRGFTNDVAQHWMTLPGARPHWAKEWSNVPGVWDHVQKVYKEDFDKFREQLAKSGADPDGLFLNDCLKRLLYSNGHRGSQNDESS